MYLKYCPSLFLESISIIKYFLYTINIYPNTCYKVALNKVTVLVFNHKAEFKKLFSKYNF